MKGQKFLHFRVNEEIDKQINSVAAENDLSKSETIRQALACGLEKFFIDSQGEFLKEKISEIIDTSIEKHFEGLLKSLEKRIIALLVQNSNYTLQSYSLIDRTLKLLIGFNGDKIKSLSDEKLQELIKARAKIFEDEAKGFMNSVYEKSRKKEE